MLSTMLSAKKTKIHGMKSRRWTTQDKITQYNGLVRLYARDKKILETDNQKGRKQLKKEIKKIRERVDQQRKTLNNAIQGDKQRLRNTLSDNRNLLLAYQEMHPTKVVEVLFQENFNKRKLVDRMTYEKKLKTQKLIDLKLEYAVLEDRIKYEGKDKIPEEVTALVITAKVQDALMKNETALAVQDTYKRILTVLQKDAIYFDAVLRALQIDGYNQGKCIIKITEMGQLATEYLDDRKEEYKMLEAALKISMQERQQGINEINDKIQRLHDNVKYLIRRDSVIILDEEKHSKYTYSETELFNSIQAVEFTLNSIKEITIVAQIDQIFPRFEEQRRQKSRLEELVEKNTKDRDILLNKSKHAEEMYNSLSHVMVHTTVWYKEEKARIHDEIKAYKTESTEIIDLIKNRGELFIRVRTYLQQLAEILRNVRVEVSPPPKQKGKGKEKVKQPVAPVVVVVPHVYNAARIRPEKVEEDAQELLSQITKKVQVLVKESAGLQQTQQAETAFENFVSGMINTTNVIDRTVKEESLIDDMMLEDPQVPNRHEIKRISAEICEEHAKLHEFDIPNFL